MDKNRHAGLFCPILNKDCLGQECAMAIKLNHYSISPYNIFWKCGLVNTKENQDYGKARIISSEPTKR